MVQSSSSLVLSVIKTEVLLDCDDPANQDLLLQQYGGRIEKLSQQDKLSKFCMDAGFLNIVEIGQYFMTKDTAGIFTISCSGLSWIHSSKWRRSITNKRMDPREHKDWARIRSCDELLAWSVWSWDQEFGLWTETILTPGAQFIMDQIGLWWIWTTMNKKFQKFSSKNIRKNWMRKILHADQRPKQNHKEENLPALPRTVPIGKRTWTDVELGKYSSDYEVSKKVMYLLCHSQHAHREEDGAVQFWRTQENLQKYFLHSPHLSDSKWKACLAAGGGGNKKIFQYCTDSSGTIVYFRAFQGHSRRNLIDPSLQVHVIIQSNFFQYIYSCRMCVRFAFYHQFGIDIWRSKFEQKTDSILYARGSYGQKKQGSWCDRLECSASCTIPA